MAIIQKDTLVDFEKPHLTIQKKFLDRHLFKIRNSTVASNLPILLNVEFFKYIKYILNKQNILK